MVTIIAQAIKQYTNTTCTISNLEVTDESDTFQLLPNVLEKKPHLFQVSKNHSKQGFFNSCKTDDVFLGKDCIPNIFLISTPTREDNIKNMTSLV